MTIPPEAIEAATRALMTENACAKDNYNRCKVHTGSRWDLAEDVCRDAQGEAELALEVTLPALERQIREQVARELAEEATRLEQTKHLHDQDQTLADAMVLGVRHSAKIARGKEQP